MKNKDIEKKIYEEFNERKPEIFSKILEQCPDMNQTQQKESVWSKLKQQFSNTKLSYSFASVTLVVLLAFILFGQGPNNIEPFSVIAIDVNPSIVLELDGEGVVIEVLENNEDAIIILEDMNLIGVEYNVAVNAIIGSMVINGYINDLTNSVLLSINSSNLDTENNLITELSSAIEAVLRNSNISGSVITQDLDFEQEAEDLAEQFDISEAKAELILNIIAVDPRMTSEALVLLSINDLNLLLESKNYPLDNISKVGTPSTSGLIPKEDVYQDILESLNLTTDDVIEYEIEVEQEDGLLIYELEIQTLLIEYEIHINAKTGVVISTNEQVIDEDEEDIIPDDVLTENQIVSLILSNLDILQSEISELEVSFETEDDFQYYVVEFKHDMKEYDIEVNAENGDIITSDIEDIEYDNEDNEDDEEDEEEIDE